MNNLIYLFFRRMRAPLLVLITVYAVSIGGLVLIPGIDDQGNPWKFDFFHAFYLVSYMSSTIGFGEIPYPFTPAQRLWTTISMYITVIGWLYAIGNILALIQDPIFKRAFIEQTFTYKVKHIDLPFYLICGYGETGRLLVRSLDRRDIQCVVIDNNPQQLTNLRMEDLIHDVPALCADAGDVQHLIRGGINHRKCLGVVALTGSEAINVKIAITGRLLNVNLPIICRAESRQASGNLASFKTNHIIDPYCTFADHLAMSLRTPSVHLLYDWLITRPNQSLAKAIKPSRGNWIVCGYGRFGKAIHRYMQYEGIATVIVDPHHRELPKDGVVGIGTEAVTLREAGVEKAVGIVAGTDKDVDNLSIVLTARELNPTLFLVARQNQEGNDPIFKAAQLDLVSQRSRIMVWRILGILTNPLLNRFLKLARHRQEEWARRLLERIHQVSGGVTPETWSVTIDSEQAPAVCSALDQERDIRLGHLLRDPQDRSQELVGFALLLVRGEGEILLPGSEEELQLGDRLLFCASPITRRRMSWILFNSNALEYVETGEERPDGYVWRFWHRLRQRQHQAAANPFTEKLG